MENRGTGELVIGEKSEIKMREFWQKKKRGGKKK